MDRREALRTGAAALGLPALAGCAGGGPADGPTGTGEGSDDGRSGDGEGGGDDGDPEDRDGDAFEPLARLPLAGAYEAVVGDDGAVACVATGDGFLTVDLSEPGEPAVLAERSELLADHPEGPMELVFDCALDGDDLLVVGAAQPRSRTVNAALRYDVSDPADPALRAVRETDHPIHNCDVDDGVAYLTANSVGENPVVIVDLDAAAGSGTPTPGTETPASGTELARWSVVDADPAWGDVAGALRPAHDVTVRDGVAYVAYWDAGTQILDVSDPADPTRVAGIEPFAPGDLADLTNAEVQREMTVPPGNHHVAAPSDDGDLLAVGVEAWGVAVGEDDGGTDGDGSDGGTGGGGSGDGGEGGDDGIDGGPGGVTLYDVSTPTAPERLATIDPPASPDPTYDGVWTTAHNFELRGDRLYTAWYEGGLKIHDVSDPTTPTELSWWRDPATASLWTARVGVPGEFLVATSTDERPVEPALYAFPDRAGEQPDPPPMDAALGDDG